MNIEIALDPYKIAKESSSFTIQTGDDYIKARYHIRALSEKDSTIKLIIKNRGLMEWFKDLEKVASFKTIFPTETLKSLLNRSDLPNILIQYPQKIVDLNLIDLAYSNPIKPNQTSLDWILEVTISFPWIRENLKEGGDVTQVLEWILRKRNTSIDNVLFQLCIEKIKVWGKVSPFRELLEWLEVDPFERGYLFLLCQVIEGYPESEKAKWLQSEGQWSAICQLQNYKKWLDEIPRVNKIEISPSLGIKIRDYIERKIATEGLTIDIVKELSGILNVEENVIYRYLVSPNTRKSELSIDVLDTMQGKFVSGEIGDFLLKLRPVDPPPVILENSTFEDIVIWLEKYYFPYRLWCRTVDREELLDAPVESFENWLINRYSDLLSTKPDAFVCGTRKIVHSLIQNGACVLLVIVDGLSWGWRDYIVKKIKDIGLYLERDPEIKLSMLPSISEVSKPLIISGLDLSDDIRSTPLSLEYYNQLFKESYKKYAGEYVVATDSTDTLFTLLQEESNVYLYLFNEVDSIAHEYGIDILRDNNIKIALDKLLSNLIAAVQEYERLHQSRLKVILIGDHGYLPLPKHFNKISINDSVPCHHSRVALIDNIDGCYSLKSAKAEFSLTKGFNILGKKPRGSVHGGLTPDELVVPMMILSTTPSATIFEPSITLDGEVRRHYHACQFKIEITNPNPVKLNLLDVQIDFIKILDVFPIEISPTGTKQLEGILDASNISDAEIKLRYQVKSTCLGQDNNIARTVTLKTKGAALVDKSFEEEFDV